MEESHNVSQDTLYGIRDRAKLGFLCGCGLRRSEVVGLRVDQMQLEEICGGEARRIFECRPRKGLCFEATAF